MYSPPQGRRFINKSIKFWSPLHQIVHIINNTDDYFDSECRIIGWTATRVILFSTETGARLTRVPNNLTQPHNFTEKWSCPIDLELEPEMPDLKSLYQRNLKLVKEDMLTIVIFFYVQTRQCLLWNFWARQAKKH